MEIIELPDNCQAHHIKNLSLLELNDLAKSKLKTVDNNTQQINSHRILPNTFYESNWEQNISEKQIICSLLSQSIYSESTDVFHYNNTLSTGETFYEHNHNPLSHIQQSIRKLTCHSRSLSSTQMESNSLINVTISPLNKLLFHRSSNQGHNLDSYETEPQLIQVLIKSLFQYTFSQRHSLWMYFDPDNRDIA